MRVAEISVHSCPQRPLGSGDVGGMNLYIRSIAGELGKLGVEVDIFARRHNTEEPDVIRLNEKVRLIHITAGEPYDIPKMNVYGILPEFLANVRSFVEKDGAKYDLLRSHYWTSAVSAEQLKNELKVSNVVTFHTLGEVKNRAMGSKEEPPLRTSEERGIIGTSDCIIASTQEEHDNLIKLYKCPPGKIRIIPGGVDLDLFRPIDKAEAKRELHLEEFGHVLLFAGRIQPIKGLELLLHAIPYLPDGRTVKLVVVGGNAGETDNEMRKMTSLSHQLGIEHRVEFAGPVEHGKMPLYYNAADICVIPSYHESFGLVAVEALASGTPVVASKVGGLATIVKDGETGYLVDKQSAGDFARTMSVLIKENKTRESMARAARNSVLNYSWSNSAKNTLRAYEELTGKSAKD